MRYIFLGFILVCLTSCYTADDGAEIIFNEEIILSDFLENKTFVENEVIACAASDNARLGVVNVYFYPEIGAKNFKLYQSWDEDSNNFSSYQLVSLASEPLFQGALRVFEINSDSRWFTVVFELDGKIEIATPIRNKVDTQPSIWSDTINIDFQEALMPLFSWNSSNPENTAIFFQVVSTEDLEFLSGTYTEDNNFQYYNLNNVVLNVTQNTPPNLVDGETYVFTLMDVSLDNWVNEVIMSPFVAR